MSFRSTFAANGFGKGDLEALIIAEPNSSSQLGKKNLGKKSIFEGNFSCLKSSLYHSLTIDKDLDLITFNWVAVNLLSSGKQGLPISRSSITSPLRFGISIHGWWGFGSIRAWNME